MNLPWALMAYFHCRTRTRTRIPVLCKFFPLVQIQTDPLVEMYVIGTETCPWNRDSSLKWVQCPFGKGIWIWIWVSGNMFCITLCSHRVWNPSLSPNLNPSPAVEISHKNRKFLWLVTPTNVRPINWPITLNSSKNRGNPSGKAAYSLMTQS